MMSKKIKRAEGNVVAVLPVDVLMLVFKRLPAKTLCSLRCVSKQWLQLISDPFFVNHLHWDHWNNKPFMLGVDRVDGSSETFDVTLVDPSNTCSTERFSLNFKDDSYAIAYCSGLLLFFGVNRYIHVCNPSTREVFTIDHRNIYSKVNSTIPNYSSVIYNLGQYTCFGFQLNTCQHKFVDLFTVSYKKTNRLDRVTETIEAKALVVTLPSKLAAGSWKYIHVNCLDFETSFPHGTPICVGGVMYWLIRHRYNPQDNAPLQILTFDLGTEIFQMITCPVPSVHYRNYSLVELQGVVCMVDLLMPLPVFDIWGLKDLKNAKWVKEYNNIDYSVIPSLKAPYLFQPPIIPCQVVADDMSVSKSILINSTINNSFYSYSLKEKSFTELGKYGKHFRYKFIHYGSLRPVLSCVDIKEYFWNILFDDNS